jgi:hypothetical protein
MESQKTPKVFQTISRRSVMKIQRLTLALSVFALGLASAASGYHVTLTGTMWAGSTELKPGEYQVQVENGKAVFKNKKNTIEVPAKMETANSKFQATALSSSTSGGKEKLDAIEIGGTNTRIVMGSSAGQNAGE